MASVFEAPPWKKENMNLIYFRYLKMFINSKIPKQVIPTTKRKKLLFEYRNWNYNNYSIRVFRSNLCFPFCFCVILTKNEVHIVYNWMQTFWISFVIFTVKLPPPHFGSSLVIPSSFDNFIFFNDFMATSTFYQLISISCFNSGSCVDYYFLFP